MKDWKGNVWDRQPAKRTKTIIIGSPLCRKNGLQYMGSAVTIKWLFWLKKDANAP